MTKAEKQIYTEVVKEQQYCQICGSNQMLAIHHIRYGAVGRKTYKGNLIRLCKKCHDEVHSNKKYWQPKLIEVLDKSKK